MTMEQYSDKLLKQNEKYPWYGKPGQDSINSRIQYFWEKDTNGI